MTFQSSSSTNLIFFSFLFYFFPKLAINTIFFFLNGKEEKKKNKVKSGGCKLRLLVANVTKACGHYQSGCVLGFFFLFFFSFFFLFSFCACSFLPLPHRRSEEKGEGGVLKEMVWGGREMSKMKEKQTKKRTKTHISLEILE